MYELCLCSMCMCCGCDLCTVTLVLHTQPGPIGYAATATTGDWRGLTAPSLRLRRRLTLGQSVDSSKMPNLGHSVMYTLMYSLLIFILLVVTAHCGCTACGCILLSICVCCVYTCIYMYLYDAYNLYIVFGSRALS